MAQIPVIPLNAELVYMAEGAANIVYRIHFPHSTPEPTDLNEYGSGTPPPTDIEPENNLSAFDGKLIRLRKATGTTRPVAESQALWEQHIKPLFSEGQVVQQSLVDLRPSQIIQKLNKCLQGNESFRDPKRRGIFLADDDYGLLVTDMSLAWRPGMILHEIKPKWLLQSPSAPANSVRCRQCARQTRIEWKKDEDELADPYTCPLDLMFSDPRGTLEAGVLFKKPVHERKVIRNWLQTDPLLKTLRDHQGRLDPIGPLDNDPANVDFLVAMTLRDCTLFLHVPEENEGNEILEARLGDLDVKSPDKAAYWKTTEQELIEKAFYQQIGYSPDFSPNCVLSPDRDHLVSKSAPTNQDMFRGHPVGGPTARKPAQRK